jgi:hypothetical protein
LAFSRGIHSQRIASGDDYVAFLDQDKVLHIADVLRVESLQTLGKIKGDVVAMEYVKEKCLLAVLDSSGVVTSCRFPEFGPWIVNDR